MLKLAYSICLGSYILCCYLLKQVPKSWASYHRRRTQAAGCHVTTPRRWSLACGQREFFQIFHRRHPIFWLLCQRLKGKNIPHKKLSWSIIISSSSTTKAFPKIFYFSLSDVSVFDPALANTLTSSLSLVLSQPWFLLQFLVYVWYGLLKSTSYSTLP